LESASAGFVAEEERRAPAAGVAALVGAVAVFAGFVLLRSALGGGTNFEGLEDAHAESSKIWLAGVATALGYFVLTGPLLLLFRAAQARSENVRNQFVGLVVMGPILLGLSGIGLAAGTQDAADSYIDGRAESTLTPAEAREECAEDRRDMGADEFSEEFSAEGKSAKQACVAQKREEDRASNAIRDSSIVTTSQFVGLAGPGSRRTAARPPTRFPPT
jgi:hypothetical protein